MYVSASIDIMQGTWCKGVAAAISLTTMLGGCVVWWFVVVHIVAVCVCVCECMCISVYVVIQPPSLFLSHQPTHVQYLLWLLPHPHGSPPHDVVGPGWHVGDPTHLHDHHRHCYYWNRPRPLLHRIP